jgi:hypothetical protein
LNTTLTAQFAAAASEPPQVLVCENGFGLAAESAMLPIGSGSVPLFETVTEIGALATFII